MKSKGPLAIAIALSVFAAPAVQSADPAKKPASPNSPDKKTVPAKAEAESAPVKAEAGPAISDPVAVVEGVEIKKTDLDAALTAALAQSGRTPAEIPPEQKLGAYNMVLEDLIAEKLINKRSGDIKITDDEVTATLKRFTGGAPDEQVKEQIEKSGRTVEAVREDIRQSLRQQRWVEEQVKGKVAVTDAEAEEFYKTNQDKFKAPERVRASHILVSVPADAKPEAVVEKEKAAQAIAARVKKGEDFAKLAQELSEDPSAKQNSGDLDFFAKGQMVPEFSEAAFGMKKGDISEPVRSQFGYHIIKVTDRKDAETVQLAEAKPQLMQYLEQQKKQGEVEKLIKGLRQTAEVKVNLPPAPAEAAGSPEPDATAAPATPAP